MNGYQDYSGSYLLTDQLLNDTSLGTNVVLKPQSRNTLHWLQASLLQMISALPRPSGSGLNFTDSLHPVPVLVSPISVFTHSQTHTGESDRAQCQLRSIDAFDIQVDEFFVISVRDTCIASAGTIYPPRG